MPNEPLFTDENVGIAAKAIKDEVSIGDFISGREAQKYARVALAAVAPRIAERERAACAKIVEGRLYQIRYRQWPQINDGNLANENEITRRCDRLAAAIRARGASQKTESADG